MFAVYVLTAALNLYVTTFFSVQVIIEKWLLIELQDGRFIPYFHEVEKRATPASNQTTFYDTMFPSFFPDFLDLSQLTMPTFCADDVTGGPTTSPVEGNEPAINPLKIGPKIIEEIKAQGIAGFFKKLGFDHEQ